MPGIGKGGIEPAELFHRLCHRPLLRGKIGRVTRQGQHPVTHLLDQRVELVGLRAIRPMFQPAANAACAVAAPMPDEAPVMKIVLVIMFLSLCPQ